MDSGWHEQDLLLVIVQAERVALEDMGPRGTQIHLETHITLEIWKTLPEGDTTYSTILYLNISPCSTCFNLKRGSCVLFTIGVALTFDTHVLRYVYVYMIMCMCIYIYDVCLYTIYIYICVYVYIYIYVYRTMYLNIIHIMLSFWYIFAPSNLPCKPCKPCKPSRLVAEASDRRWSNLLILMSPGTPSVPDRWWFSHQNGWYSLDVHPLEIWCIYMHSDVHIHIYIYIYTQYKMYYI